MEFINSLLDRISLWSGQKKAVGVLALFLLAAALAGGISLSQRSSHQPAPPAGRAASLPPVASTAAPLQPASPLAGVQCRLPISNNQPGGGGFISFPSATFAADPGSSVQAGPYQGLSYVRGAQRWLRQYRAPPYGRMGRPTRSISSRSG